ncbi:unnamed protein product [Lymnaea stagnalis]|uniref:Major facilitator superfamily (MFS) profile domain-containing protein n=1 Tax=Lymnaea stagnalis TaxID=6523 RepID=A0AAV2H0D5_LYMST
MNAVISAWAPKTERARLINIAYAGVYLSPALANFSTGASVCYVSWDSIMYIYGGVGALWSVAFLLFVFPSPHKHPNVKSEAERLLQQNTGAAQSTSISDLPWRRFFTSLPVIAIWVGAFCRNFVFAMLITAVQQYYKDVYGLSSAMNGLLNGLPHIFMGIFMIMGSFIFDYLAKYGILSMTKVRKLAQGSGFGVMGGCILAIGFLDNHIQVFVLFCVGVAFSGFAISGYQTNPLDLAPQYAGPLTGISRTGMAGAIVSTALTAQLAGNSHSLKDWQILFIIGGSLHLAGVVFYSIFASGRLQKWAMPDFNKTVSSPNLEAGADNTIQGIGQKGISPTEGDKISDVAENDPKVTSFVKRSNYGAVSSR